MERRKEEKEAENETAGGREGVPLDSENGIEGGGGEG